MRYIDRNKLGAILLEMGRIDRKQLECATRLRNERKEPLGKILVDEGIVSEEEIMEILAYQLGIPHVDMERYYIEPGIIEIVPEGLARKYNVIPIQRYKDVLVLAMSDPTNIYAIDEVKLISDMQIQPAIASRREIITAIEVYYGKQTAEKAVKEYTAEGTTESLSETENELLDQVSNAPVVRLVNSILEQAVVNGASDIHIEPGLNELRVRFRIDGQLQERLTFSMQTHGSIVARVKIMSQLNIAERRLPQDGRIELETEDKFLDLRVSVLPTVYGEKVVIRVLDRDSFLMSREQLGLNKQNRKLFDKLLEFPHGIILVTGPTGSGKTTTLYAALRELNKDEVNIITLEDPVEYKLEGINQTQINPKAGLTFATGLRSVLRQDPNIIMVGEIRDEETASLAVRAAITGHLVLSTMHTNDAASSVIRLMDMGIEPYLAASSIRGVISQRLVRKVCPKCITKYKAKDKQLKILGYPSESTAEIYMGEGCSRCFMTGYKGRTAVHEIMLVTEKHKRLISQRVSSDRLDDISRQEGMMSLRESCKELVLKGATTVEEMARVVYSITD